MNKRDINLLRLMHDAAREALTFTTGETRASLDAARRLVLSLLKSIELIGDVAYQISDEGKADCPAIPWEELIDQANSVTGVYFHINLDMLWQTVTRELPPVVATLEQIIAESDTA